jgi:hypothetical protein
MRVRKISTVKILIATLAGLLTAGGGLAFAHAGKKHAPDGANADFSAAAQQVVDTLNGYTQAVASKDMVKIERYVVADEGFSHIEGTFTDIGWQSYREHLAPEMELFEDTRYTFTNFRPYVSGDMAYASFDYALDVTIRSDQFAGGKQPVSMRGKGTAVLIKAGDTWKIRHMHTAAKRDKEDTPTSAH